MLLNKTIKKNKKNFQNVELKNYFNLKCSTNLLFVL